MMMRTKGIFILTIAVAFATFGCRKKNPQPLPLDSYAASFFTNYQPGTYWVYQDSTGLITDSEAVTFSHCGPEINRNNYEQCYSEIYADSINDNALWQVTRYDTFTLAGLALNINNTVTSEIYSIYFNNNQIDTSSYLPLYVPISVTQLGTYHVNQFVFNNAIKISSSPPISPYSMYIVIVPNVGIVERLVPDSGYVLKLKRYHIVS